MFIANGEVVKFDGFLKVYYRESSDDEADGQEDTSHTAAPSWSRASPCAADEVVATQRFSQGPLRYTEASLVRKLEELGHRPPVNLRPDNQHNTAKGATCRKATRRARNDSTPLTYSTATP